MSDKPVVGHYASHATSHPSEIDTRDILPVSVIMRSTKTYTAADMREAFLAGWSMGDWDAKSIGKEAFRMWPDKEEK